MVLDSVLLVQLGVAVPHLATAASTCVHDLSYASHIYFLTLCVAPHKGMNVGGAPIFTLLKCESWPLMPSREFNSLFIYLGEALHPWLKKISVIHFISFVSSN